MATGGDVLGMLCPNGGWAIRNDDYDLIMWVDGKIGCTREQFEAGFDQYDAWKAEQEAALAADRASATAKLEALGLTGDDLKALGL
jgi:hypothetical protein